MNEMTTKNLNRLSLVGGCLFHFKSHSENSGRKAIFCFDADDSHRLCLMILSFYIPGRVSNLALLVATDKDEAGAAIIRRIINCR